MLFIKIEKCNKISSDYLSYVLFYTIFMYVSKQILSSAEKMLEILFVLECMNYY